MPYQTNRGIFFLENKLDHNHKEVIYGFDAATPKSLLSACKHFFGLLPHQKSAIEFGQEYKKLTSQDKLELKAGLEAVGYHITESAGIPAHA